MDRQEILKLLSTHDLTEDEKEYLYMQLYFTEELNRQADEEILELHKEQKENRDSILNQIAKIMLSYPIIESIMSIGGSDKLKLKKQLNTLIQNKIQSELNSETLKTKELLKSTGKNKYDINNYINDIGMNVNWDIKPIKDKTLNDIINKKVDDKTWDDRLWNNKNDLQKDLKTEIDNFLNGKTTVNEIEDKIKKKYNENAYESKRLVQDNVARVQEGVNEQWRQDHNVKWVLYMATLCHKTCGKCSQYDGKDYPANKKPVDLPQHPFCKCTYVNLLSKDWRTSQRLDNVIKEKVNWQTYEEWKEKYNVDTRDESDIIKKIGKSIKHKITDENPPLKLVELPEKHLENISKIINDSPDYVRNLILNKSEDIKFLNIKTKERAHYDTKKKGIRINLERDSIRKRGNYSGLFHEIGHNLDHALGRPSQNKAFKDMINQEVNDFIKNTKISYNLKDDSVYEFISNELKEKIEYHSTADIFEGVTKGKIVVGQSRRDGYWQKKYKVERETFAHFFEATVRNDEIKILMFKNIMPKSYDMFLKMIGKG